MGCRGQVKIIDGSGDGSSVYLYTHWGAEELSNTVKAALAKKWRWDDGCYLARIIFDEMISKRQGSETGFGICTSQHGDIECLVTVDVGKQMVEINRSMYGGKKEEPVPFETFIQ